TKMRDIDIEATPLLDGDDGASTMRWLNTVIADMRRRQVHPKLWAKEALRYADDTTAEAYYEHLRQNRIRHYEAEWTHFINFMLTRGQRQPPSKK
ncbi:hypothetical protein EV182_004979, partial [Spiromyces aspiralis]